MTAPAIGHGRSEHITRSEMRPAGWITLAFLTLLGIGALAGGITLMVRPDGSVLHMPVSMLAGSPFADYLVPGMILGGLFGIGSFVVAGLGLLRWRIAPFLAFAIGAGQMIWIIVQLSIIKDFSVLHPTFFGVGLAIAAASVFWGGPTFRKWLANR